MFCNQLKTVFGEVMQDPLYTESGEEIDAIFGYKSLEARIVLSPLAIGLTSSLLRTIGSQAADIYRGKK